MLVSLKLVGMQDWGEGPALLVQPSGVASGDKPPSPGSILALKKYTFSIWQLMRKAWISNGRCTLGPL